MMSVVILPRISTHALAVENLSHTEIATSATSVKSTVNFSTPIQTSPTYAPARMIIKFKEDSPLIKEVEKSIDPKDIQNLTLNPYLNALNQKYGLVKISKPHKDPRSIEEIIQKYPERAKRMPKKYKTPNIRPTYVFEFKNKNVNVLTMCAEYAKDPDVKYAEPDYLMTINPATAKEALQ